MKPFNEETVTNSVIDGSSKIGGRKKGTTKEKKEEAAQNYKEVIKNVLSYMTKQSKRQEQMDWLMLLAEP